MSTRRSIPIRARDAQSGIALVLALWLTVLLTVIASGFAFSMRTEALAVRSDDARSPLTLERQVPDLQADAVPEFTDADRSVLAEDIAELTLAYYGRDVDAAASVAPTWRDHWDNAQQLPLMIRIDVRPKQGPAWPTLYVSPRDAPEAGCRAWDIARQRCASV